MALPDAIRGKSSEDGVDRYSIVAAVNVLKLLVAFGDLGSLSLSQAVEATGVSPSTAYRLLVTLESQAFVRRVGKRGYRLGPGAVRLAHEIEAQADLMSASEDVAEDLVRLTGHDVRLALLTDTGLTVVLGLNGSDAIWAQSRTDMVVEVHASAMGKAVCANLEPPRLAALLGAEPYAKLTAQTSTSWRGLQARLEDVRSTGYATDLEESAYGLVCVAAPIFSDEHVIGSISLQGPPAIFANDALRPLADVVRQAAGKITNRLSRLRMRSQDGR